MKTRKWLLLAALVLSVAMATTGTMAYLSDTDSDVNVMTLGNVDIEQVELQRAEGVKHNATAEEGDLVPFKQGQKLYPAYPVNNEVTDYSAEATDLFYWGDYVYTGTAGNGLWNDAKLKGALDKMVFVKNTGKSDCYFRTWIAFECPEGMEYSQGPDKEFMNNVNLGETYNWEDVGYITIDDVQYAVTCATYQRALPAGAQSHPSLLQVVMTHNATNEDMEKLGDTYEILVCSQAVQTVNMPENAAEALAVAFGEVKNENNPWTSKEHASENIVHADTQEELDALKPGDTLILAAGTYKFPAGSKFNEDTTIICEEGTVFEGNSKLNINGATVVGATFSNPTGTAVDQTINGTFKDCTFDGSNGLRWCYAGETVVFENCVFTGDVYGVHFDGGANEAVFKNCTFSGFNAMGGAITKLTMEGCTFKTNGRSGYNGINLWGSTEMKDCTFVFDGSVSYEWVDACGDNTTLTFTGCVVTDGTNETPLAEVVGDYGDGNTIIIDGVTLSK